MELLIPKLIKQSESESSIIIENQDQNKFGFNESFQKFEIVVSKSDLSDFEKDLLVLTQLKDNNILPQIVQYSKSNFQFILQLQYQDQVKLNEIDYYSFKIYQQRLPTLHQEIKNRILIHEQFSLNEICSLFQQIEKCLQCLHSLNLAPTFISSDNICQFVNQTEKQQWTLNMHDFFRKYDINKQSNEVYFSQQLCGELSSNNNQEIDLNKLSIFQMKRENYFGLGVSLLQACALSNNNQQIFQQYKQNSVLKTITKQECTFQLKCILSKYESMILTNLIKFLIYTPKICQQQSDSFLFKMPTIQKIIQVQQQILESQFRSALNNIEEINQENSSLLDQSDQQKLQMLKFECLVKLEKYDQFLQQSSVFVKQLQKEDTNPNHNLVIIIKILFKHLQIQEKEQNVFDYQETQNTILKLSNNYFQVQIQKLSNNQFPNILTEQLLMHNYLQLVKKIAYSQKQSNQQTTNTMEFLTYLLKIIANYCISLIQSISPSETTYNLQGISIILKEIQKQICFIKSLDFQLPRQVFTVITASTKKQAKILRKQNKNQQQQGEHNHQSCYQLKQQEEQDQRKKQICSQRKTLKQ